MSLLSAAGRPFKTTITIVYVYTWPSWGLTVTIHSSHINSMLKLPSPASVVHKLACKQCMHMHNAPLLHILMLCCVPLYTQGARPQPACYILLLKRQLRQFKPEVKYLCCPGTSAGHWR